MKTISVTLRPSSMQRKERARSARHQVAFLCAACSAWLLTCGQAGASPHGNSHQIAEQPLLHSEDVPSSSFKHPVRFRTLAQGDGAGSSDFARPKVTGEETYSVPEVPGLPSCKKRHTEGERSGMHRGYRNLRVKFADPNDNAVEMINSYLAGRTCQKNFFMVWSTVEDSFSPREMRAVESIFRFHPRACVIIFSSSISDSIFQELLDLKYAVKVVPIDVHHLLQGTPAESWLEHLEKWRKEGHFHSNISNAIRKAALYHWGGVYLDFDVLLLRHLDRENVLSWMDPNVWINGGVMVFDKGHPFLKRCLKDFVDNYNGRVWGHNGPSLLTRVWHTYKNSSQMHTHPLTILPHTAFYPIRVFRINQAFTNTSEAFVHKRLRALMQDSYILHYYNNVVARLEAKKGSIMDHLFSCICILCYAIV